MTKQALVTIICLLLPFWLQSQTVILDVERDLDSSKMKFGPNRLHYVNLFVGFGFLVGENQQGSRVESDGSIDLKLGIRYKLKINETFSVGATLGFNSMNYKIRQEMGKFFPDTAMNEIERLRINGIETGIYARVNIGKRGNTVGKFIDFGYSYNLRISGNHYTKNTVNDGTVHKLTVSKLPYLKNGFSNTYLRFGIRSLSFYLQYRFTELFRQSYGYPDLPPFVIGIQIG